MPIDLKLYLDHTSGRSLVEVLLRGHLWVERHLISLLHAELRRPEAMNLDRMAFSAKVSLADGLGLTSPQEVQTLRLLNTLRNRLAHDLAGAPTEQDVVRLESSLSTSQIGLAKKLLSTMPSDAAQRPESGLPLRLSMVILALLTEMEQHSQWHAYWREHHSAMEGYQLMVTVMKQMGKEPESEQEYRRAVGIPEPPTPADAITLVSTKAANESGL